MKKLFYLIIVLMLVPALVACGTAAVQPSESPAQSAPDGASLAALSAVLDEINNDAQPGLFDALCALYEACGVKLLQDEACDYTLDGARICVIGVQDPDVYALNMHEKQPGIPALHARMMGFLPPDDGKMVNLVLVHRPERAPQLRALAPKLIVCGHAHGGQFRAFGRGLYAPGQGIFPRYTSGLYDLDGAKLAVCRGLGNHAFVPRINNPPHMMLLILQRG